jgi:hypothetical protein
MKHHFIPLPLILQDIQRSEMLQGWLPTLKILAARMPAAMTASWQRHQFNIAACACG